MRLLLKDIEWDDSYCYSWTRVPFSLLPREMAYILPERILRPVAPTVCESLSARFGWTVNHLECEEVDESLPYQRYVLVTAANIRWPQGHGGMPKTCSFTLAPDKAWANDILITGTNHEHLEIAAAAQWCRKELYCRFGLEPERPPWAFATVLGDYTDMCNGAAYDVVRCSPRGLEDISNSRARRPASIS